MTDAAVPLLSTRILPDQPHEALVTEAERPATGRLPPRDAAVRRPDPGPLLLTESHKNAAGQIGAHQTGVDARHRDHDPSLRTVAHPQSAAGTPHPQAEARAEVCLGLGNHATAGLAPLLRRDLHAILAPGAAVRRAVRDGTAEAGVLPSGGTNAEGGRRLGV
jgi:hypothetical protein